MNKLVNIVRLARFFFMNYFCGLGAPIKNYCSRGDWRSSDGGSVKMGRDNVFDRGFDFEIKGGVLNIGNGNYFNRNVKIVCFEQITIGDDCLIADSVHFYDHNHSLSDLSKPIRSQGYSTKPIKVGNNVWIGAKATVLKGVTIGDNAVVGANAVVTRDVPANAIAVGNPASVVKMREHGTG